ncbi:FecR domain-containing protein [Steroidobacter sp. S1-65]|uniref:FecR domain-containing protein n=1 Tax=Steroidobacter gossypii TaxID=2805490 RepID=A0ABS1WZJ1_9GAMM|nr:FecR domain-containing protein [Steroidobacter gossypii]MBM0106347.1 FecR domain-containing protein [Steroidobacter gossypii]
MKTRVTDSTIASDDLQSQAWVWLRLLNSGEVKSWDLEGFQRWLQASPAHRAAFNAARQQWDAFRPAAGAVLRRNADAAAFHQRTLPGRLQSRRAFLTAAAGAAAVAGIAVLHPSADLWPAAGRWGADYRTDTGEQRQIALSDVVKVTMNTQTSIRRQTVGERIVGIDLLAGEAAIDLPAASANGQPFVVAAGRGRSFAETAQFEVRYLDGKVCVTCVEGEVRVEHAQGIRRLAAGERTIYDERMLSGVDSIDPRRASAWRKGELVFDNARLADVIAEINRYRPGRVVLMNAAMRDKPVSGSFYIASLDQALALLQRTFDLNARTLPGGLFVLS